MTQRLAAAALALPLFSSCFTSSVWGTSFYGDGDERSGEVHAEDLLGGSVPLMILATPFSIALDICTFPVQAAVFGWDDNDD